MILHLSVSLKSRIKRHDEFLKNATVLYASHYIKLGLFSSIVTIRIDEILITYICLFIKGGNIIKYASLNEKGFN